MFAHHAFESLHFNSRRIIAFHMNKFFASIWAYLKDWKNLLVHSLVGIGLLLLAIYLPVHVYLKITIFILVIIFNVFRMRRDRKKK